MAAAVDQESAPAGSARLVAAALAGGAVAVALGVYSEVHDPAGEQPYRLFFTGTIQLKAWLCTLALLFAGFQLLSALRMYGRIGDPATAPGWLGDAHRLSGILAFLATLPVAYHCLWSLGFSDLDLRTLLHSLLGCAFYGAFVTKVVLVRSRGLAGWVLPVVGGLVLALLVGLWLTSSLWFFTSSGQPAV
ncbi:hypothetical protein B7486_59015 [cyanobacterium TDX16]|nr:hypothetical protein B7486_59015 [cyanobacterium TDX16]